MPGDLERLPRSRHRCSGPGGRAAGPVRRAKLLMIGELGEWGAGLGAPWLTGLRSARFRRSYTQRRYEYVIANFPV